MKQPISNMNRLTRAGLFTAVTITLLGAWAGHDGAVERKIQRRWHRHGKRH
jgi:hypothetical protein